jgi:hypothetical protein
MYIQTFALLASTLLFLAPSSATPVPAAADELDLSSCDPTCEFMCTKYTLGTLDIDGRSATANTGSKTLEVKFDGKVVCAEQYRSCNTGQSCEFHIDCIKG